MARAINFICINQSVTIDDQARGQLETILASDWSGNGGSGRREMDIKITKAINKRQESLGTKLNLWLSYIHI